MSKYIIKNCPNSWTYNRPKAICGLTYKTGGFKGETTSYKHCQDCTDCVMKQIVEKCKKYIENYNDKVFYDDDDVKILMGKVMLSQFILCEILDIQEVE